MFEKQNEECTSSPTIIISSTVPSSTANAHFKTPEAIIPNEMVQEIASLEEEKDGMTTKMVEQTWLDDSLIVEIAETKQYINETEQFLAIIEDYKVKQEG